MSKSLLEAAGPFVAWARSVVESYGPEVPDAYVVAMLDDWRVTLGQVRALAAYDAAKGGETKEEVPHVP